MTDLTITINGIHTSYTDSGKGEMPIIFIHGFPFDKSSWQPQVDHLRKNNRVIAYDLRGFGKSGNDKADLTIDLFADDLIALLNELKIEKVIACGLSMGGYILLNAMKRFPGKFQALILSDTQCIADTPEVKEKRNASIKKIEDGEMADFAKGSVKNLFHKDSFINRRDLVEKIEKIILSTKPETLTATLKALANREETCSTLNKIHIPALILCGAEDIVTPPLQARFLSENINDSEFHFISKAGHLSNLEQPEVFNSMLSEFISKNN